MQVLTIAVDASYGATFQVSSGSGDLDAGTGTSGSITFNNAESGVATGTLFLNNVTGTSDAAGAGLDQHHLRYGLHSYDHCPRLIDLRSKVNWGPSGPLFFVSATFSLA